MSRANIRTNHDENAAMGFVVTGLGRPRFFRTYSDSLAWVLCIEALERDIARVVRLRMMRRRAV
jgi:hypothetical protein